MNMSEDVTAVSMQVSEKAAEAALSAFKSVLDSVGRLFRELLGMEHDRARTKAQIKASKSGGQAPEKTKPSGVSATNLTGIKPGEVALKDLAENARETGEALSVSQHGFTQEDRKAIARTAKKYGIPVAFSNTKGKNNLYANVRSGDLPIFKQICTECIREKIAVQPEKMGNFKVQPWEVPHLTAMLKAHDLPAVFVETKNGEQYCLHEAKHQDAVRIVRDEFVSKCKEIEKQFSFDKDEKGFYMLKDAYSGREISFDDIPTKQALIGKLQEQFGYDKFKAELAASKFGEQGLQGKEKKRYFSHSARFEYSRIEGNVRLEGEKLFAKPYGCWYLVPKKDQKARVVFRDDKTGRFAVLEPSHMTNRKMRDILTSQLGITDKNTLDALTDKANRVTDHYAKESKSLPFVFRRFKREDFQPEQLTKVKYTNADGDIISKHIKPLDSAELEIQRNGKNYFTVSAVFSATKVDAKGNETVTETKKNLTLSLDDKKKSLEKLTELFKNQGISEADAQEMAKTAFKRAEQQSTEKVVKIQEIREKTMTVAYGAQTAEVSTADKQKAAEQIAKDFGIPKEQAETIVDKAEEIREEAAENAIDDAKQAPEETVENAAEETAERPTDTPSEAPETATGGNGHEMHPEGNLFEEIHADKPIPDVMTDIPIPDTPDVPDMPKPAPRGARR